MKITLYIILAIALTILALFVLFINLNAIISRKKRRVDSSKRKNVSAPKLDTYTKKLSSMINCKTIADGKHQVEFEKFRALLKDLFPLLHQKAQLTTYGEGCLIYKITGVNAKKNIMLMSHHDVVDAKDDWTFPPFSGAIADGLLWGRGSVDTKTPLFSQLQAVEELLESCYDFLGINLYIGSSSNEEICGDGMPLAVADFAKNGIRFDVVMDEGGAITTGMLPSVSQKSAMIAVHEKGRHTFTCTAKTHDTGHLGLNPVSKNVIDRMSEFIVEVKKTKIFKAHFQPEVRVIFERHAPYMSYPFRLLFANIPVFKGLLLKLLPKISNQVGGMLQTTLNFTSVECNSESEQISGKVAVAKAFFRCVRDEDLKKELLIFNKIAKKHDIEIQSSVVDYCKPTAFNSSAFNNLENLLNKNFPDVIVSPFLLTAGTDARHFTDIAESIFRFAPIDLSKQQFASVHNSNENISVQNIGECVCFYKDYIQTL